MSQQRMQQADVQVGVLKMPDGSTKFVWNVPLEQAIPMLNAFLEELRVRHTLERAQGGESRIVVPQPVMGV